MVKKVEKASTAPKKTTSAKANTKPTPAKAKSSPVAPTKSAASAGVSKTRNTKGYAALENIQRKDSTDLKFYLFHAPASELYQWGLIDRTSPDNPKAIQRRLNKTKVLRIKEFLSYEKHTNTIATSVVIVFNKGSVKFVPAKKTTANNGGQGTLEVSWTTKGPAGVIVDGQHRVIGAHEYTDEDIHLNVVGITGADDTEGAFQFLVINNNSSKVSSNQVKALFTSYKEEELLRRMLDSGSTNVDEGKITALDYFDGGIDSPFKKQLKWVKNSDGFVVPNALEAGLNEVQNRSNLLSVVDLELDTFVGIWAAIKEVWGSLWNGETHLLEKASVQALTAFICENLENQLNFGDVDVDYTDPSALRTSALRILKNLDPNFFEVEWAKTGLDTRAGHELLVGDLKQMASNVRKKAPWYSALETVNIGAVSGDQTKKGARPKKAKP